MAPSARGVAVARRSGLSAARRPLTPALRGGLLAALAVVALTGCAGGPNLTASIRKAEAILPQSLRSDRSDIRDLSLEIYRDLRRPVPLEPLKVILERGLPPVRFMAMLATSEEAYSDDVALSLERIIAGPDPRAAQWRPGAADVLAQALRSRQPVLRTAAEHVFRAARGDHLSADPEDVLGLPGAGERLAAHMSTLAADLEARRELISRYLDSRERTVRLAAVYGMALLGDSSHMDLVAEDLGGSDAAARRAAAMILGLLGNPTATGMLRERLKDRDPMVRLNAAESLVQLKDPSGLAVIRTMAGSGGDPRWQVNAILALGRVGRPAQDVRYLRELDAASRQPGHKEPTGARIARWGARAMLGDYSQVEPLMEIAAARGNAPDEDRAFALQLLAHAGYGPAWKIVAAQLDDPDELVRTSAAWALLSFQTPRAERVIEDVTTLERPDMLTEEEVLRQSREQWPVGTPGGPLDPRLNEGSN